MLLFLTTLFANDLIYDTIDSYGIKIDQLRPFLENDAYHSNHYKDRNEEKIDVIVLHITSVNFEKTMALFTNKMDPNGFWVSAHYIVKEDGKIVSVVPEDKLARHAGTGDLSFWNQKKDLNQISLGFEIVNETKFDELKAGYDQQIDWKPIDDKQLENFFSLLKKIVKKYKIEPQNIIGHSDCAYARDNGQGKIDPGPLFPWKKLYQEHGLGMGLSDKELDEIKGNIIFNKEKLKQNLIKIGYKEPKNDEEFKKLIYAFQCHFSQNQHIQGCTGIPTKEDMLWSEGLRKKYTQELEH